MKLTAARKQGLEVLAHAVDPVRPADATSAPGASPYPTVKFETAEWLIQEGLARIDNDVLTPTDEGRTLAGVPANGTDPAKKSPHQARQDEINRQAVDSIEADRPKEILTVPLDKVRPASDNIRPVVTDDDEFAGLVASVKALGILEPLLVTATDDGFEVFAGSRRLAAAIAAGRSEVPIIVHDLDALGRLERMIAENLQRKGLSPLEEANAFAKAKELGMKQKDIAARSGISEGQVSKRLALLKLPERAVQGISSGKIPVTAAEHLTKLVNEPKRLEKALKEAERIGGNVGDNIEWAVKRQLQDVELEQRRTKVVEELEAQGIAVIEHPGPYNWRDQEQRPLRGPWADFPSLEITPEDHQAEPCHGASVSRSGSVVYICLDPRRHSPTDGASVDDGRSDLVDPDAPALFDDDREINAAQLAREEWTALAATRWEFIVGLIANLPPKADVTEYLLIKQVFADDERWWDTDDVAAIATAVGLEVDVEADPWEDFSKFALSSGEALTKLGLTLALRQTEQTISYPHDFSGRELIHRHFALLTSRGYQMQPPEFERLGLEVGQKPGTAET